MKRLLVLLVLFCCLSSCSVAEIDLSGMSFAELCDLEDQIQEAKKKIARELASEYAASLEEAAPVVLDVSISSVKIDDNSIGSPEIYVVLKNDSSTLTIDRIDFRIKCFDAYGDLIKLYNRYTYSSCFYDDSLLKPGSKTPASHRWTIYDGDGTKSVKVAIEKYHATDGTVVTVPEDHLEWIEFE